MANDGVHDAEVFHLLGTDLACVGSIGVLAQILCTNLNVFEEHCFGRGDVDNHRSN